MLSDQMKEYGNYIYETFTRVAIAHPEHEFIFIFDQPFAQDFLAIENVAPIIAGPQAKYPLLWKYWYDIKIPALLKKWKADVFVSTDGFCSLRTTIPQCIIFHDLGFLNAKSTIKKSHASYLKKNTPRFLEKAITVITVSSYLKQKLVSQFKTNDSKIEIAYGGPRDTFQPITTDHKIETKNNYTDGKEYFVYAGIINQEKNLINLLKAFSVFKKRQQSNLKLVLAGKIDPKFESFEKSLSSYKYREEVVVAHWLDVESLACIVGAAYGYINPSQLEEFNCSTIESLKCDVPVIAASTNTSKEMLKNAALFVDASDYNDIADKMMLLYKDEKLRNDLIIKGREVAAEYNWEKTAQLIWLAIQKTIS